LDQHQQQAAELAEFGIVIHPDAPVDQAEVEATAVTVLLVTGIEFQAVLELQGKGFQEALEYVLTMTAKIHTMVVVVVVLEGLDWLLKTKINNKQHTAAQV
jgi:hypothetical protein